MVPRLPRTLLALVALALLAAGPLARAQTNEVYLGGSLAPPAGAAVAFDWDFCWSVSDAGMASLSSQRCEEARTATDPWAPAGAASMDRVVVGFILLGQNRCLVVDAGGVQTCNIPEPCLARLFCPWP